MSRSRTTHHRTRGTLGLAAERRRRKTLQFLREVATAEGHRNRAHLGMAKAEAIVNFGIGAGFNMAAEVAQLADLRQALAVAEAGLAEARQVAGLDHAA